MASIFKRSKKKNEPYLIQYVDHLGKRRTVKAFTDKSLTEQLAAKLETEARLRETGMIDTEKERFAELDRVHIDQHLAAFEENLSDNSPKYVRLTMSQVRRVVTGAGFQWLSDIDAESIKTFLRTLRFAEKFGHRTYNQYLQAMTTFCNWCASTRRLPTNPVLGIERLNTAVDVRHPRRALTAEEFAKLVQSARSSGVRIQGYSGEQRARIYLLSYLTGLRRNEISSLTSQSFSLKSDPPTLMVDAKSSKHRRKDVLPLHPELAEMLPEWLDGLNPGEKLFPKLADRKTWRMVKMDLERAGIPYQTEEGIADFHAAGRHTHITELLRNGASLPEAKELARHSDIKTTMKYTHIGIADQARAVGNIPVPKRDLAVSPARDAALHRRCISGDSDCLPVSQPDADGEGGKRQNPRDCEGFGSVLHSMSQNVKVGVTRHR